MKISRNLASMPDIKTPVVLAVGTFDGVHLGHRKIINEMKKHGTCVIFTFTNHPSEALTPNIQIPYITPPEYKLQLLDNTGADICLIQPFSTDMAHMTYNLFLEEIHSVFHFDHIFFGGNDCLGKNRDGNPENIASIGKHLGFTPHYLEKLVIDGEIVSSSKIRKFLNEGNLKMVEKLLGRPFSAYVDLANPFIDATLLKVGKYTIEITSPSLSKTTTAKIDKEGNILFDFDIIDHDERTLITFIGK